MHRDRLSSWVLSLLLFFLLTPAIARAATIKAVQSGTASLANGTGSTTANLGTTVDPTKSFLTFSISFTNNTNTAGSSQVTGQLNAAGTVLTFQRSQTAGVVTIQWYVVEFTTGVTVQRGNTAIAMGSPTTINVNLTNAVIVAKTVPMISTRLAGTNWGSNDLVSARITGTNTLQLAVTTLDPVANYVVEWQVIQFDDATVQSNASDLTMADGVLSVTDTIASPVNLNKAWLIYTYRGEETTVNGIGPVAVRGRITDRNQLTFDRDVSDQAISIAWQVVEFADATVVETGSFAFPASATTALSFTGCPFDTTRSVPLLGYMGRGGKTTYNTDNRGGSGWARVEFTGGGTAVQVTRGFTGTPSTSDFEWTALRFEYNALWCFNTGIASVNPPALKTAAGGGTAIYAGNNNGDIFGLDVTSTNNIPDGKRVSGWTDFTSPVAPIDSRLGANALGTIFLGSEDGCFYSISQATGLLNWWSGSVTRPGGSLPCSAAGERLADIISAAPVRDGNSLMIASRNTANAQTALGATQNMIWSVEAIGPAPAAGTCQWVFNGTCAGAAGATAMGSISNTPALDTTAHCLYFTTLETAATDRTVWAIRTATNGCTGAGAAGTLAWSLDGLGSTANIGSVGAAPALTRDLCTLYVGNDTGRLFAINTGVAGCAGAAGSAKWTGTAQFNTGVNAVFSETLSSRNNNEIYFSVGAGAAGRIMRVNDPGAGVAPPAAAAWSFAVASPTLPTVATFGNILWAGSTDGSLHQLCQNINVAPCSGAQVDTTSLVETGAAISSPTLDIFTCSALGTNCKGYVGASSGRIYGKTIPY